MTSATEYWLQGVHNAAYEFRPVIYSTDEIPTQQDLLHALQILSRLSKYGGFITGVEELYAQEAEYALEHFAKLNLTLEQCAAARDAITASMESYYHYDPAVGYGLQYQLRCFMKTMKDIDLAIARPRPVTVPERPFVKKHAITCCTTPYYKHNEDGQQKFKYDAPKNAPRPKQTGTIEEIVTMNAEPQPARTKKSQPEPGERRLDAPPTQAPAAPKQTPTNTQPAGAFIPVSSMLDELLDGWEDE
jgi:hypothetical protein